MLQITPWLAINPRAVSSMSIDRRFYMNGSASYLVLTMTDGQVHRIEHGFGVDIFEIEKRIKAVS